MGSHPANCFERNNSQQARAHEGTNPREEEEEPHDGTLHGLGSRRIGKLQTCEKDKCKVMLLVCKYTDDDEFMQGPQLTSFFLVFSDIF